MATECHMLLLYHERPATGRPLRALLLLQCTNYGTRESTATRPGLYLKSCHKYRPSPRASCTGQKAPDCGVSLVPNMQAADCVLVVLPVSFPPTSIMA